MKQFSFRYFYPNSTYRDHLRDVERGESSLFLGQELVGDNFTDPDLIEDLVRDHYREAKQTDRWVAAGLVELEKPEQVEPMVWYIGTYLTGLGVACLKALDGGFVWGIEEGAIALEETERWYRRCLNNRFIPDYIFDIVERMEDPILVPIREELVYAKLTGTKDGSGWVVQ